MKTKILLAALIAVALILLAIFLPTTSVTQNPNQSFQTIPMQNFVERYTFLNNENDENVVMIDVRTPGEYQSGHIPDAINIDFYGKTFKTELDKLDKDKTYFIYCRSGSRSSQTMKIMKTLKFKTVFELEGGISSIK